MSEQQPDLADYLAGGGDFEDALASAVPMNPLAQRKAENVERARAAIKAALLTLGAPQTTRAERQMVARSLTGAVDDLAWLEVLHPSEWSSACAAMHACGQFAEALTHLRRAVKDARVGPAAELRAELRRTAARPGDTRASVLDVVLGDLSGTADLPEGLVIPRPWVVNSDGTFISKETKDGETQFTRIAQRPIFLVGTGADLEDETQSVVVRWHTGSGWRSRPLSRKVISVARLLAEESEHGLPVSSENARHLVAYFEAFLGENEDRLPRRVTTKSLGWKKDGFMWGATLLGPEGPVENANVELSRLDAGLAQAVQGYRAAGTWEGWCDAIRGVAHLPRVMLSLLAAMAPPLLYHLPAVTNGIIDWAGETTGGKTSTLRVGASVWGYPEDRNNGLIRPWEASAVFVERLAALCNDLPVFLDDTKRVRKKEDIGKILYMVAQGQGRGRGTLTGLDVTATWRTFLQSTGEAPATSYAPEGGAAARCLTVWGNPFDSADTAESTASQLRTHYGHLGPRLVVWLQQPGAVDRLRAMYDAAARTAADAATGNVERRVSSTVALLSVCAEIAAELGVPGPSVDILPVLTESVLSASRDADKATDALAAVHGWAVANATSFYGRHVVYERWDGQEKVRETRIPHGGWLGMWKAGEWGTLGFMRDPLQTFLTSHGYDANAILRTWRGRGWLRCNKSDSLTGTMVMPNRDRPQGILVKREALETAIGGLISEAAAPADQGALY